MPRFVSNSLRTKAHRHCALYPRTSLIARLHAEPQRPASLLHLRPLSSSTLDDDRQADLDDLTLLDEEERSLMQKEIAALRGGVEQVKRALPDADTLQRLQEAMRAAEEASQNLPSVDDDDGVDAAEEEERVNASDAGGRVGEELGVVEDGGVVSELEQEALVVKELSPVELEVQTLLRTRVNGVDKDSRASARKALALFQTFKVDASARQWNDILAAFSRSGDCEQALRVLEDMRSHSATGPDSRSYDIVVDLLRSSRRFDTLRSTFDAMLREGVQPSPRTYADVIAGMAASADFSDVVGVLKQMLHEYPDFPRLVAVYHFLEAAAQAGTVEAADTSMEVYSLMVRRGLQLGTTMYNKLLAVFRAAGEWERMIEMLEDMRRFSVRTSAETVRIIIQGFREAGEYDLAIEMFENMRERHGGDLVARPQTYDDVIASFYQSKNDSAVLRLFNDMIDAGVAPLRTTFHKVIRTYARLRDLNSINRVMEMMKKMRSRPGPMTYTHAIVAFGQCGHPEGMQAHFDDMMARGMKPNVVIFGAMMEGFLTARMPQRVLDCMRQMEEAGIEPTSKIYTSIIKAFAMLNQTTDLLGLLAEMRRRGVQPNVVTYTALITSLVRSQDYKSMMDVWEDMKAREVTPNVMTYTVMLDGFARSGDIAGMREMLREMVEHGVRPNLVSYNNVLKGLAMSGAWEDMLQVYEEMQRFDITPDQVTYNQFIAALAKSMRLQTRRAQQEGDNSRHLERVPLSHDEKLSHGAKSGPTTALSVAELRRAFEQGETHAHTAMMSLFREMKQRGIRPNVITYSSLIDVMGKNGRFGVMMDLFHDMQRNRIKPNEVTFGSMVSSYRDAGMYQKGIDMVRMMKRVKLKPTVIVYSTLIDCYGRLGDTRGMMVAFREMKRDKVAPNIVTYTTLMAGFGVANDIPGLLRVYLEMNRVGIRPNRITDAVLNRYLAESNDVESRRLIIADFRRRMGDAMYDQLIECAEGVPALARWLNNTESPSTSPLFSAVRQRQQERMQRNKAEQEQGDERQEDDEEEAQVEAEEQQEQEEEATEQSIDDGQGDDNENKLSYIEALEKTLLEPVSASSTGPSTMGASTIRPGASRLEKDSSTIRTGASKPPAEDDPRQQAQTRASELRSQHYRTADDFASVRESAKAPVEGDGTAKKNSRGRAPQSVTPPRHAAHSPNFARDERNSATMRQLRPVVPRPSTGGQVTTFGAPSDVFVMLCDEYRVGGGDAVRATLKHVSTRIIKGICASVGLSTHGRRMIVLERLVEAAEERTRGTPSGDGGDDATSASFSGGEQANRAAQPSAVYSPLNMMLRDAPEATPDSQPLKQQRQRQRHQKQQQEPTASPKQRQWTEEELKKLKVTELKDMLRERKLRVSGVKADLIARLLQ